MDILDHIEKIVDLAHKKGIDRCQAAGKEHINYVAAKLDIGPLQAVLFSLFMGECERNDIRMSKILKSVKCSTIKSFKYMSNCEELEKKKLIRCRRDDDDGISYRIPREVLASLQKNDTYVPEKTEDLSISAFFVVLGRIFKEKENKELTDTLMEMELLDLINQNMHLLFCKKTMSYKFDKADLALFLRFCDLFVNNNDDCIMGHDLEFLYDDDFAFAEIKDSLQDGSHVLMDLKFVEHTNNNGFADTHSWKLTDKAKKELLAEIKGKGYRKNLILFDTIKAKKMYYNPRETGEIQRLISLMQEKNFRKIQSRLDGNGMRKGFACLFSGGPGTGKTETAYQIARETKRNIMMVDISQTKSMWFGESEKKIKEIFDKYRTAVENSEITPILLFNEADAVIGKRMEFNSSSRAVDQTQNTIQNIILQEIENLSGILIATTNLTQNMDSAFERRFLYKVTFDKPSRKSRVGIWRALLPGLSFKSAVELSSRFELSGGQIENIARKTEVDAILNGDNLTMETLLQYCKDEAQNSLNASKKIGFTR